MSLNLPKAQSALTPKSEIPWSSKDALIRLVMFYGLILVFMLTFQLGVTGLISNINDLVVEAFLIGLIGIIMVYVFLSFDDKKMSSIGFELPNKKIFLVLLGLLATSASLYVAYIIEIAGNVVSVDQMLADRFKIENLATPDQLVNYLILVLMTFLGIAMGEEIMFRGYIQNVLQSQLPYLKATLISSIMFGFIHSFLILASRVDVLNRMIAVGVSATIFGFVFAYAFKITGNNLMLPILIHGIWDSIIFFYNTEYVYHDVSNILFEILSQLVAAAVLVAILYAIKRFTTFFNSV